MPGVTAPPSVMNFSSTTPFSGDFTGICSPSSPVGSSEFVMPRCSISSSARRNSVCTMSSASSAATRPDSARWTSCSATALSARSRFTRSTCCSRHRQVVLRPAPLGERLAVRGPRLVDDRADHVGEFLAGLRAVADLHEDLEHLALDLRPDARRPPLVERDDAGRLERGRAASRSARPAPRGPLRASPRPSAAPRRLARRPAVSAGAGAGLRNRVQPSAATTTRPAATIHAVAIRPSSRENTRFIGRSPPQGSPGPRSRRPGHRVSPAGLRAAPRGRRARRPPG